MAEIKAGDVVQLKSGGQQMTVEWVNAQGYARCVWFVGGNEKANAFKVEALKIVEG